MNRLLAASTVAVSLFLSSSTVALVRAPASAQSQRAWQVGDHVLASFEGSSYSFYGATIVAVANGKYKVHYDGYAANWDDWVPAEKIKPYGSDQDRNSNNLGRTPPAANTAANRVQHSGGNTAANPPGGTMPAATTADAGGTCRVGSRLSRAGLTNRPAVITAIDDRKGLYRVKYDNGDLPEWLPPRLFKGCTGHDPAAISTSYFIGTWSLFVGPTPHYEDRGANTYLVVGSGAKAPPLTIRADGSYVWTLDATRTVRGRWRPMAASELKYGTKPPAIVLLQGESGKDWEVHVRPSVGVADTRDRITVERMDMGVSYMGTRR